MSGISVRLFYAYVCCFPRPDPRDRPNDLSRADVRCRCPGIEEDYRGIRALKVRASWCDLLISGAVRAGASSEPSAPADLHPRIPTKMLEILPSPARMFDTVPPAVTLPVTSGTCACAPSSLLIKQGLCLRTSASPRPHISRQNVQGELGLPERAFGRDFLKQKNARARNPVERRKGGVAMRPVPPFVGPHHQTRCGKRIKSI